MAEKLRAWWEHIKKQLEITAVIICLIVLVVLIMLIFLGYIFNWAWVGLGSNAPSFHGKTLWDWLQLLIIPAVLAIGGYVFNLTVSRNEQKSTQLRDRTERQIALDSQQEAALQAYIDKMSELLLEKKLRGSAPEDEVRKVARVRTLTVLQRLDTRRKGSVLQFLHESGLIEKDKTIIDLNGAELNSADLIGANLTNANLTDVFLLDANLGYANLTNADLSRTALHGADLSHANLTGANLYLAHLYRANFSEANVSQGQLNKALPLIEVTMPDGTLRSDTPTAANWH
jgi:uncharacterized protein YjbI with pentapeptide repeats